MIKILLCCASGMSTSLLVEKMKRAAIENNIEAKIWMVGANEIKGQSDQADVLLLGPQVRYAKHLIQEDVGSLPLAIISMKNYGMMDGEAVLQQAMDLYNSTHK